MRQALHPCETLFRAATGAFKNDICSVAARQILDACYGILLRSIDHVIGSEFARHRACFGANIDSNDTPGAADTRNLHAFQSHAALPEDRDGVSDPHACGFDGRNAVAERLKARGLTVGDPVVNVGQRDFGQNSIFRETPG